jgi:type II secretory pathway component GspD/PulD (secretin)
VPQVCQLPLALALLAGIASPVLAECPATAKAVHSTAPDQLLTKTYCVADLVIPVEDCTGQTSAASLAQTAPTAGKLPAPAKTQEDKLIHLLTTTLGPKTWSTLGGPGMVEYFPLTYALVITQTANMHEQIADLLAALRRMQGVCVSIEVRFISVPTDFWEWMAMQRLAIEAKDLNPPPAHCAGKQPVKVAFLDDKQLHKLLEAAQGDQRTNVMQAPKLTAFNGQQLRLNVTDVKHFVTGMDVRWDGERVHYEPKSQAIPLGVSLFVKPVVSADRRFVRLDLRGELTNLESSAVPVCPVVPTLTPAVESGQQGRPATSTPSIQMPAVSRLSVDQTLTIPAGGTALLMGWRRQSENRNEYGPPVVVSKIPYARRIFKNVSYGRAAEDVLLAVTPRIIIQEEEEVRLGVRSCPCGKEQADPVGTEEQEYRAVASPRCKEAVDAEAAALVRRYHRACTEGRAPEATSLAVRALALDPACFSSGMNKGGARGKSDR